MLWESGWSHSERRWSLFYSDKASVKNRQKICSGGWVGGNCTELDAHNFGNFVGFTIETPGSCTRLQWIHGKARAKCLFAPSQDAPASCPSSLACTSHVYFTHQFLDGRRWATEKKKYNSDLLSLFPHIDAVWSSTFNIFCIFWCCIERNRGKSGRRSSGGRLWGTRCS